MSIRGAVAADDDNSIPQVKEEAAGTEKLLQRNTSSTIGVDRLRRRRRSNSKGSGTSSGLLDANDVKASVNIVDVIESYNLPRFERRGLDRATALCPFHDDNSPSLSVDGGPRQMYKCFACGAGGDVFAFVRNYHALHRGDLPEVGNFYQSVRYVRDNWGDTAAAGGVGRSMPTFPSRASSSTSSAKLTEEERIQLQQRKERVLLANAAAAAFYADYLLEPDAGDARTYVRSRGLTPATVRRFALGYAPDAFYGTKKKKQHSKPSSWGDGSLVHHLKDLGFSPHEILDAGLATQVNVKSNKKQKHSGVMFSSVAEISGGGGQENQQQNAAVTSASPGDATNATESLEYSSLMDRFRNRLMIPILDSTGKKVLAFGGRTIPDGEERPDMAETGFEGPKYLNSPESVVFHKQEVLFGEHQAREAMQSSGAADVGYTNTIVLVEGYMDAIALSTVGVETAVAIMGTALSKQQLAIALRIVGGGGRVVMCFDNDDAGAAAVERVCSNGMLQEICNQIPGVGVRVAALPDGFKDPDDFIQAYQLSDEETPGTIAEKFESEVIQGAVDWVEWYVGRITLGFIPSAQRGQNGSFSNIFGRVAEFLAKSLDLADRTKTAFQVSGVLAELLARDSNASDVSDSVRSQLETDLLDLTSRIANTKEGIQRRVESVMGNSPGVRSTLSALSRGEGLSSNGDEDKLSFAARKKEENEPFKSTTKRTSKDWRRGNRERKQIVRKWKAEKPLTPHFRGFQFAHKSDADWLGISEGLLLLGTTDDYGYAQNDENPRSRRRQHKDIVYFGSNRYHGNKFLTEDAAKAGYARGRVKADPSLLQRGLSSLVRPDFDVVASNAEDLLLKSMVRNRFARTVLKNLMHARKAVGSEVEIAWTSKEKGWLLQHLIDDADHFPEFFESQEELRSYIAPRWNCSQNDDVPLSRKDDNAAPKPESESTSCEIDDPRWDIFEALFISEEADGPDAIVEVSDAAQCELSVQQYYVTFLWASSVRRVHWLEEQLEATSSKLRLLSTENGNETLASSDYSSDDEESQKQEPAEAPQYQVNDEETEILGKEYNLLTSELSIATRTMQSLANSVKRLTTKIVDETVRDGLIGMVSPGLRNDLVSEVEDFAANFEVLSGSPELGGLDSGNSNGEDDRAIREDFLEKLRNEWGPFYDDELVCSFQTERSASLLDHIPDRDDDDEDEERFLERIKSEWGNWMETTAAAVSTTTTVPSPSGNSTTTATAS